MHRPHHWADGTSIKIGDGGYFIEVPKDMGDAIVRIASEVQRARAKHPVGMRGAHEGYAVILEELDEMWDEVKRDNAEKALNECAQVGAMALRYLIDMAHGRMKV